MVQVTVEEAQEHFAELLEKIRLGDEVVVLKDAQPVARIMRPEAEPIARVTPQPGNMAGALVYMAPDFDAPLEDFSEYME